MKRIIAILLICCALGVQAQKTGLSLAGGAALGYTHLGFLQAMEDADIKPDCIVGTSMGAIMGMMYAAGYSPLEIKQIIKDEHMDQLLYLAKPGKSHRGGLISTNPIQDVLLKYVPHNNFDSLKTRFYCCTFNMDSLKPVYQGHGPNLVSYVMASASMPFIFAPTQIDSCYYVDGGIHDNMPIIPLMDEECTRRIASFLILEKPGKYRNIHTIWLHAFNYSSYITAFKNLHLFTDVITIDPEELWLKDFKAVDRLYDIGYKSGKQYFKAKSGKQ